MKNIKLVVIRSEGGINGGFELMYEDGSKREYESIDQGRIDVVDDGKFELSDDECKLLMDMWYEIDGSEDEVVYGVVDYQRRVVLSRWVAETIDFS